MSSTRLLPNLDDAGTSGGRVGSSGSIKRPSSQDRLPAVPGSSGSSRDVLGVPSASSASAALSRTDTGATSRSGEDGDAAEGQSSGNFNTKQESTGSLVEEVDDSKYSADLKKRVDVARKGGRLDLAGLALERVPALALELGNLARVVWLQENLLKEFEPSVIATWRSLAQVTPTPSTIHPHAQTLNPTPYFPTP